MQANLVLLDGVTGSGKSTLLELIKDRLGFPFFVGKKITDRKRRATDNDWEFDFVEGQIESEFKFKSVGSTYAICETQLANVIDEGKTLVLTCVDLEIVLKLKANYKVKYLYIYRYLDEHLFEKLMIERNVIDHEDYVRRKQEVDSCLDGYLSKLSYYDGVIINHGSVDHLLKQFVALTEING